MCASGRCLRRPVPGRCGARGRVTQKEMVPSDPPNSPFTNRLARSELGIHIRRGSFCFIPRPGFWPARIKTPQCTCYQMRTKPAPRNGLSLAYGDDHLSAFTVAGSSLPAYLFDALANVPATRSAMNSTPQFQFPETGEVSAPTTRCRFPTRDPGSDRRLSLHVRVFDAPSSRSTQSTLRPGGLPGRTARLPFAPHQLFE